MSVRATLRSATREAHDAVDHLFGRFDLSDATGYRGFLAANRAAFIPVEAAIDLAGGEIVLEDWPGRRRADLLIADVADMKAGAIPEVAPPRLTRPAEVLGAIYVLEGSRLGGALLRRSLVPDWSARFLNAPAEPGSWPKLLATLEARLTCPGDMAAAIDTARAVFQCFGTAAQQDRKSLQSA